MGQWNTERNWKMATYAAPTLRRHEWASDQVVSAVAD
jgi:hypothetical protein